MPEALSWPIKALNCQSPPLSPALATLSVASNRVLLGADYVADSSCKAKEEEAYPLVNNALTLYTTAAMDGECYFCGYHYHPHPKCPVNYQICLKCGKRGYFANVCKSSVKGKGNYSERILADSLATLMAASPSAAAGESSITTVVNGQEVHALGDSGSAISFLNPDTAKAAHS